MAAPRESSCTSPGGPTAVTRFCRSLGDRTTRLDRWEPELNSAEPWRMTDTTSPRAIGQTYARLTLGDALPLHDREQLTQWLLVTTTSGARFRKSLPTGHSPIVLAVLTTKPEPDAPADDALIAKTAALLATALT